MDDNSEASFNNVLTIHLFGLFSACSFSAPPFDGHVENNQFSVDVTTFGSSEQLPIIGTLVPTFALPHFNQGW